jgi:hypothetical protein
VPKYTAIPIGPNFRCSESNLLRLAMDGDQRLDATFSMPGDEDRAFRVTFDRAEVLRVLDEMPLSTEPDTLNAGLVRDHFAYAVEDAAFWSSQSEAMKMMNPSLKHYRFITGWVCLDVISEDAPEFSVVPSESV